MYRKILVPLDGSSFAEFALPVAEAVAAAADAEVELVMVQDPSPPFAFGERHDEPQPWRQEYLSAVQERLGRSLDGRVDRTVRVGAMPDELEKYVGQAAPDLVVMATHGRGPLSRLWLGSVADHMVRRAPCPVLLTRPEEDEEPDFGTPLRLRRLLVPLDGSRDAEAILPHAFRFGDLFGASYRLLRVVHYPAEIVSAYLPDTVHMSEDLVARGQEQAREYLDELAARLREEEEREVETDVQVDVHPVSGILRSAREDGADAVALATHGRSGVRRALLGSTADKLIRSVRVPALVHRPPEIANR